MYGSEVPWLNFNARPRAGRRQDVLGSVYPYLLPLLLFLAITGISRQAVLGFAVVALVLSVGRTPWGICGAAAAF